MSACVFVCSWCVFVCMCMFSMGILHTATLSSCIPHCLISISTIHTQTRTHVDTHTHTSAHSLSAGGCFRCSHRRCGADNRLWQMSRHHLKAVTCSRIETNQRCHRVAWSRLRWSLTLLCLNPLQCFSGTLFCYKGWPECSVAVGSTTRT